MEFPEKIKPLLSNPIRSLREYQERIKTIENYFAQYHSGKKLNLYYRGDHADSEVCCKLFYEQDGTSAREKLSKEATRFSEWKKTCTKSYESKECSDIYCLAKMQHMGEPTRLLDFSTDSLVALRFACGRDNAKEIDRKITIFATNCAVIDIAKNGTETGNGRVRELMQLVNNDSVPIGEVFRKDYFIQMPQRFARIRRQKGLFLFMGNFTNDQRESSLPEYNSNKVAHSLSMSDGRGTTYSGYVGTLKIPANVLPSIRDELEAKEEYKMSYLLPKEEN